jgi:uncharacterized protein YhjY with autotransporter beta-barrel domain
LPQILFTMSPMKSSFSRRLPSALALAFAAAGFCTPLLHARPHNGLDNYIRFFGGGGEDWFYTNTSTLSYGAMGNIPALVSAGEVGALLRQIDAPYYIEKPNSVPFPSGSRDGHHPASFGTWEAYAFGQWNYANYDNASDSPVFDPQTWGATIGLQRWVDGEHLFGFTASAVEAHSRIHDNGGYGGGRINGENYRLRFYTALAPEGQPWWFALGASGAYVEYDTRRDYADILSSFPISSDTVVPHSSASASPQGYEVGLFAALNARIRLTEEITLKPLLRVDYTSVSIAKFRERGNGEFAYKVNRFDAESLQSRLGAALEHQSDYGPFYLTAACSVVWADEWSGNDTKITGSFANITGNTRHSVRAGQLFSDAMEITPSLSLTFRNGIVLQGAWQLQVTFNGQFAQTVTGSFGWRF